MSYATDKQPRRRFLGLLGAGLGGLGFLAAAGATVSDGGGPGENHVSLVSLASGQTV